MRISKISTSNQTPKFQRLKPNYAFQRKQYLERFEKSNETKMFECLNNICRFVKSTLITAAITVSAGLAYITYQDDYKQMDKDGSINYIQPLQTDFETREAAIQYAINRIKDVLNSEEPYEHAVYIDNATNEILAEFKGNEDSVSISLSLWDEMKIALHNKGVTVLHGHPQYGNGLTNPISYFDFETLVENDNITSVAAVDKNGNISALTKKVYFSNLSEEDKKDVLNSHISILSKSFEHTRPQEYYDLVTKYKEENDSIKKDSLSAIFNKHIYAQDSTTFSNRGLHKFWKSNAQRLGLEYHTNFENSK